MKKNKNYLKLSNNKKVLKRLILLIVAFIIVVLAVSYLCVFIIRLIFGGKAVDDGTKVGNRVSEEGQVVEHDPDGGMYTVSIEKLIAGGNSCATIEEFANDHKVEVKDVSQLRAYYAAESDSFHDGSKDSISLEEFTNAVKNIFGDDYDFRPEEIDFSNNCSKYKYNSSSKKFVKSKNTCKYSCNLYETSYKVVKVIEEYGKYTLDVKVLFIDKDKELVYYSDFGREKVEEDAIFLGNLDYSKGATYRFIFESKGSNYYFVSSELVNEKESKEDTE